MTRNLAFLLTAALTSALMACHKHSDQQNAANVPSISVARPVTGPVTLSKSYPATLAAADEVDIIARVGGRLEAAPYTAGPVSKGDVLFEIERKDYADAVSKAEAALESARARRTYAASHLTALQEALKADAVSRMEVEQARSALQQIDADIKTAQANLADARTQLGYCTIRAPFSGRVARREVDPGTVLSPGTRLTSIYNEDHFLVNFNIEESQYLQMIADGGKVEGSTLNLTFSEPLDHDYSATVTYVSPNVDTSTGTYRLQATLRDPYGALRSGMYATASLPYRSEQEALMVLGSAIGSDQRGEYLYTLSDSNTVVYTPVSTGPSVADTLRVITSGITPATPYVTKALLKVRPGEKVSPKYE